jgi:hypothetical protein
MAARRKTSAMNCRRHPSTRPGGGAIKSLIASAHVVVPIFFIPRMRRSAQSESVMPYPSSS